MVGSNDAETTILLQQNYLIGSSGLAILLLLMLVAGHFFLRTYRKQEERELRYRALYSASHEIGRATPCQRRIDETGVAAVSK